MASGGKQQQAALDDSKRKQDELYGLLNTQLQTSQQKSPLEQGIEQQNMDWLNFTKDPKRDYRNAPGLTFTGMFSDALQQREDDRKGIGGLAMGSGNGQLADVLKSQRADRAAERGGIGLANAVQTKDANARGDIGSLLNLQNSRNLGLSNTLAGAYGGAAQNFSYGMANRQASPLWGVLGAGLSGLGTAATGRL